MALPPRIYPHRNPGCDRGDRHSCLARCAEAMKKAGFACEFFENDSFAKRDKATGKVNEVTGKTFLWCDREKVVWRELGTFRWQVIPLIPNGKVEDLIVGVGAIDL